MSIEDKLCKICNKSLYAVLHNILPDWRIKDKIYCSKECMRSARIVRIAKLCKTCLKEFFVGGPIPHSQKYCSLVCFGANNKGKPKTKNVKQRIEKNCKFCNKTMRVHPYRQNTQEFCNKDCYSNSGRMHTKCTDCGDTSVSQTNTIRNSVLQQTHCKKCIRKNGLYPSTSSFQYDVFLECQQINSDCELNKQISTNNTKSYIDVVINRLAIECNGDYFHCNPKMFDATYYNASTQKFAQQIWDKDQKRLAFIKQMGFNIFIIWESEWKQNKNLIISKIKELCNTNK